MEKTEKELVAEERERLISIMNVDPVSAINEARRLKNTSNNWKHLRAIILCDAGAIAKDVSAVEESAEIFYELFKHNYDNGVLVYNLANSLSAQARIDTTQRPDWFLFTAQLRRTERALYGMASDILYDTNKEFASRTMTNLGNSLDEAHRWIEAIDCYNDALTLYPRNGAASGCAAEVLVRISRNPLLGHKPYLINLAKKFVQHTKSNLDIVADFCGPAVAKKFDDLSVRLGESSEFFIRDGVSEYERFVVKNRLLLSPIFEGAGHNEQFWDDAHIKSLTERYSDDDKVPAIFAMFNVMKSDYLVARKLLFEGMVGCGSQNPDTGLYIDTLDNAVYGESQSKLILSQRAALDILDKIAVAINDLLSIGENPNQITFATFWSGVDPVY